MTTIDIPLRNPCALDVLIFPWVLKLYLILSYSLAIITQIIIVRAAETIKNQLKQEILAELV